MIPTQLGDRLGATLRMLLTGDTLELVQKAIQAAKEAYGSLVKGRSQGLYEVLRHDTTLHLVDARGDEAIVQRVESVRFLQDYVTAFTDYAWGDGDLFAEYRCAPGVPVDFYQEGSRRAVLISLRETKRRGESLTFRIHRLIRGGFLSAEETRVLLDRIDVRTIAGLRDRALIGVMVYSFARVGAVTGMNVEDYFQEGKRGWFRLHEKGGKLHEVPAHHNAEAYVDAYLAAAQIAAQRKGPLFRSLDRRRRLTERRLHRLEVLAMIKRRARQAGLPETTCCHTFRATGITTYLQNGGTIEHAQQIAAHESPRTTKLYDRTHDAISLDEIERILI